MFPSSVAIMKEQKREYDQQHYEKNRDAYSDRARRYYQEHRSTLCERTARRAQVNVAFLAQIKLERGCIDCGYRGHPEALDFDHVTGTKIKAVGKMVCFNRAKILEEVAKCEVRCKNCHAVATAVRRSHPLNEGHDLVPGV